MTNQQYFSHSLLTKLVYKPGQEQGKEDAVIFPLLEASNVLHAICIGPGVTNMAESCDPKNTHEVIARQEAFLSKHGFSSLSDACIHIVPPNGQAKIIAITEKQHSASKGGTVISAECLFTTLPTIPLIHKPADCPTIIITALAKDGKRVLGIAHLGRPQVNERVTEQVIDYLFEHYGSKPKDIIGGISPSIGPQYYFIKQKDQKEKHIIDRDYWGKFAYEDEEKNESIIRVDIVGKILSVLHEKGIPEANIQVYSGSDAVDTFALASKNPPEAFSYRYAIATNQPERNGRMMVVCQLQR